MANNTDVPMAYSVTETSDDETEVQQPSFKTTKPDKFKGERQHLKMWLNQLY
ncbi:MAG: hypothetical protein M1822_009561, partial [Bathelium mastoideum]